MEEIVSAMGFCVVRPTMSNNLADQKEARITSVTLFRQERKS
jgi:hypothetical protein